MASQELIHRPVLASRRVESIDVVRGFAMLGILVPNILAFGWPSTALSEPGVFGMVVEQLGNGPLHERANEIGHLITQVFYHGKMMFLFGLLFGSGVVMYARKFDQPGQEQPLRKGAALWYQRMGWLLAIGFCHAVFLWFGDILMMYAVCGLGALWWLRRVRPMLQLVIAGLLYLVGTGLAVGMTAIGVYFHNEGSYNLFQSVPSELLAYRDTYGSAMINRLIMLAMMYLIMMPLYVPIATGIMLAGIALTRLGVLTGERSSRFYIVLAASGLTLGLGGTSAFLYALELNNVQFVGTYFSTCGQLFGIPTSLGYAALLILLVKHRLLRFLTHALASVGRMALSNYLSQTIICTTLFYGYGFGLYGEVQYPQLWLVIAGVWVWNIVFSLVWLRFFAFGPAEWLWRSLTYRRLLRIRHAPDREAAGA
jgi:uncharacterized protein